MSIPYHLFLFSLHVAIKQSVSFYCTITATSTYEDHLLSMCALNIAYSGTTIKKTTRTDVGRNLNWAWVVRSLYTDQRSQMVLNVAAYGVVWGVHYSRKVWRVEQSWNKSQREKFLADVWLDDVHTNNMWGNLERCVTYIFIGSVPS